MRPKLISEFGSSPAPTWDFDLWTYWAGQARADAVKVQLFQANHFPRAEQASKKPLEFPRARIQQYVKATAAHGLEAGASVFDFEAVRLAALYCDWLKLAAREQDNGALLAACRQTGKRLYRSISDPDCYVPGITTLATVQRYPLPLGAALLAVTRWAVMFRYLGAPGWGWSSHTRGVLDVRLAVTLGAGVIEKHMALSPHDTEAGHSLSPLEFRRMLG